MKIRYVMLGLTALVALAVAVPALATTHSGQTAHRGAAPAHPKRGNAQAKRKSTHARQTPARRSAGGAPSFTVAYPTAAERAQLARTGSVTLPVIVEGSGGVPLGATGAVSVTGEVPVGEETETAYGNGPEGTTVPMQVPKNFEPAIEPASVTVAGAGTVGVTLKLNASAKAALAAGERLQLDLDFSSPPAPAPSLMMFVPLRAR
jgi:hypothetical protein